MRGASAGLNLVDSVYERLLAERIIFLGSQVDDDIANKLCAQILLLSAEDPTKDIHLYITSPGGSISAGLMDAPGGARLQPQKAGPFRAWNRARERWHE